MIESVPAIYQQQLEEVSANRGSGNCGCKIAYSQLPSLPKSMDEVHFEGEWTETHSGEHLLMVEDDGADKLIIFSTVNNVRNLAEADKVFMNDTLRPAPDCFIRYSQYMLTTLLPTVFFLESLVLSTCKLLRLSNKKLKTLGSP